MRAVTDLSKQKIYSVFDMLDVDHSGLLDFDEFYFLVCILIAVRVGREHTHTVPRPRASQCVERIKEFLHCSWGDIAVGSPHILQ